MRPATIGKKNMNVQPCTLPKAAKQDQCNAATEDAEHTSLRLLCS